MKYLKLMPLLFLVSCAMSKHKEDKTVENINVPKPVSENVKNAKTIYYSQTSSDEKLQSILDSVAKNINNQTYVLSKIVPKGTRIKRDKAVTFLPQVQKTENLFRKSNEISLSAEKSEKFYSYKLSINYHDSKGRKKIRSWLLSLDLNEAQLKDHITNTLVRFSFQSL